MCHKTSLYDEKFILQIISACKDIWVHTKLGTKKKTNIINSIA